MSATSSLREQAAGAFSPVDRTHHFIAGRWREASGTPIAVLDAFTEATMAHVPAAGRPEVDDAVDAARRAFDEAGPGSWRSTTADDRAEMLRAMADHLEDRTSELAALAAREVGTPIERGRRVQVGLPVAVLRSIADLADTVGHEEIVGRSLVVKEPVGVVGAIGPWNYPLYQLVAKVAPALLAGCTVVAKPAMVAPLTAFALADAADAAGLPAGVFNLVSGRGVLVGEALAGHPAVDMVSFTGSTSAGARIGELAAASITRVALELGGKSACVVLDDADLVQAVGAAVASCFLNNGQTCVAQTRLLVSRHQFDEAEALAKSLAERFVLGDPLDPATTLGPLAGPSQLRSVRHMVADAIDRGARVVTGGAEPTAEPHGFFHRPTVLVPTGPEDPIAQEEVFGPVLSLLPYDGGDDSAVALANNSPYGLSGAVWSASPDRAEAVARRMRTGQVSINGGAFDVAAPFGGYKRSGLGRELGPIGLEEFFEVKALLRPGAP